MNISYDFLKWEVKTKWPAIRSFSFDSYVIKFFFLKKLGFTPLKAEKPIHGMMLQEKEAQKN